MLARLLIISAVISAAPIVSEDVLEPSVQNEVDHAISRAPTNSAPVTVSFDLLPISTNSLSRTDIAIKLVSAQRADGRWLSGTNDCTSAVLRLLKSL